MKGFLLGVVVGIGLYHFADEHKKKQAAKKIGEAAGAVSEAASSIVTPAGSDQVSAS